MPDDLSVSIAVNTWRTAPAAPVVQPLELHLWHGRTTVADNTLADSEGELPPDEKQRAARLARPEARLRYIAGRVLLRRVLGDVLGAPPRSIRFAYSPAGKPAIAVPAETGLCISLSHAEDTILIALARGVEVGVDVERLRAVRAAGRIARRVFGPATLAMLDDLPADERRAAFLHAWTQREAVIKALGGRLFLTADPLPFDWPRPARPWRRTADETAAPWTLFSPSLGPARVATTVAAGRIERIHQWSADPLD